MFTQKEILEEFAELSYLGYNRIGQEEFLWRKREYDAARMRSLLEDPVYRRFRNSQQRAVYPRYYMTQKAKPDFKQKRAEYAKKYWARPDVKARHRETKRRYVERNSARFTSPEYKKYQSEHGKSWRRAVANGTHIPKRRGGSNP